MTARGTFSADESSGLLLYPDEEHYYHPRGSEWYVHWISFSGHHIASMLHYVDMTRSGVYRVSDPTVFATRIRKALSVLQTDYPLKGMDGSVVVYQLLLDFLKFVQREGEESRDLHVQRIKPALELIEREIHRPLSLDDLASSVGVTKQYFCELFRSITSHRPTEYLNQRRVDRAKEILLRDPKRKIHDVARRVGFESDSYFSTVFRKYEGISPRRYRETNAGHAAP